MVLRAPMPVLRRTTSSGAKDFAKKLPAVWSHRRQKVIDATGNRKVFRFFFFCSVFFSLFFLRTNRNLKNLYLLPLSRRRRRESRQATGRETPKSLWRRQEHIWPWWRMKETVERRRAKKTRNGTTADSKGPKKRKRGKMQNSKRGVSSEKGQSLIQRRCKI